MKKNILKLSTIILSTVAVFNFSCKDKETDYDQPLLTVIPSVDIEFEAKGIFAFSNGIPISTDFDVETNQSNWEVNKTKEWLHIDKTNYGFSLSADPNTAPTPRSDEVTVTSGKATPVAIRVQQAAKLSTLAVFPSGIITISPAGGSEVKTFTVNTNENEWSVVSSDESWLTVNKIANKFTLSVTENLMDRERMADVIVSATNAVDVKIQVTQEGHEYTIIDFNEMSVVRTHGRYGDIYQIDLDFVQGEFVKVINISNINEWLIDLTFFNKISDGMFTFLPMDGRYSFRAYPKEKLFSVNPINDNMQSDGTGGLWIKGTGVDRKQPLDSANDGVGWATADRIPMARMSEKINRMIFVGEVSMRSNAMIYFHYQDGDYAPSLINITNATPDLLWFWEGDTSFIFAGTLEKGAIYELIVDTTAGLDNPVVSLTKR